MGVVPLQGEGVQRIRGGIDMAAKKSATPNRAFKVADQIQRDLTELIARELKDPRVGMVTLQGVEVTPDYAHAKVFFSTLAGKDQLPEVKAGLQRASGFLRRELGKRISIHMTPQLSFVFDQSLERGADLSKLIQQAVSISERSDPVSETDAGEE